MASTYLRRGLAAGLLAGLLAGVFAFFVGEPLLDRAIAFEEASADTHGGARHGSHHGEEEVFSRPTQKVGLFFATGLFGTTVGGVFGLVFAFFRGRLAARGDLNRSLYLTAALFAGAFAIPFLKYPANPPSVGDPSTIGARTAAYFTLVALSLLAVLAAWLAARRLRGLGVETLKRRAIVGAGLLLVVSVLFSTLPPAAPTEGFPSGLLWGFRLSSFGTQLVFWAGLGALFGLLCERANRRGGTA